MKNILDNLTTEIQTIEAIRDLEPANFTDVDAEYLASLNICYDLLCKTKYQQGLAENWVQLGEMADPIAGEKPTDLVYRHGNTSNDIAEYILINIDGSIADWIRKKRKAKNMTQYAYAKLLGISHSLLKYWEEGKSIPGFDKVKRINDIC